MNLRITAQLLVVCLLLAVVFAQIAGAQAHHGPPPLPAMKPTLGAIALMGAIAVVLLRMRR